jgi:hypothetical protein
MRASGRGESGVLPRMERRRSSTESLESLGNFSDVGLLLSAGVFGNLRALVYLGTKKGLVVLRWPFDTWRAFRSRGYVFTFQSLPMTAWDLLLAACALYFSYYLPFSLVFTGSRWEAEQTLHSLLDVLFLADIIVKLRTGYRDRGYDVVEPGLVMRNVEPVHNANSCVVASNFRSHTQV